jgi:hypothetical protein
MTISFQRYIYIYIFIDYIQAQQIQITFIEISKTIKFQNKFGIYKLAFIFILIILPHPPVHSKY